jgi:hypothetical protein
MTTTTTTTPTTITIPDQVDDTIGRGSFFISQGRHNLGISDGIELLTPCISLGPMDVYTDLIAQGSLKEDAFQRTIIETLQEMHDRLMTYNPEPIVSGGNNAPKKERGLFSKVRKVAITTVTRSRPIPRL